MLRPNTLTALTLGDEPPKEFRIWGFGVVDTLKGEFHFDQEDATKVMAAYADYGNELSFDYNHQAILSEGDAPAAGWFNLELRDDGLWATNIRWTPLADERIRNKEYRYVSPAFLNDVQGHIHEVVNIALTNIPATKNLEPLVAANRRLQKASAVDRRSDSTTLGMSFGDVNASLTEAIERRWGYSAWLIDVYDDRAIFKFDGRFWAISYHFEGTAAVLDGDALEVQRDYTPVTTTTRGETQPMKTILKALGLSETATEAEALVALQAIQSSATQVVTLTGKTSMAEALGVITANKTAADQVATLTAENTELKNQLADGDVKDLIDQGLQEGKIPPAMVESLTAMGKANIATLKAYLEHAPKMVPTDPTKPPNGGGGPVALSVEEKQVCTQLGIKPEDFVAHRQKTAAQAG